MSRRLRTNADALRKIKKAAELLQRNPEMEVHIRQLPLADDAQAQFGQPYIQLEEEAVIIPVKI